MITRARSICDFCKKYKMCTFIEEENSELIIEAKWVCEKCLEKIWAKKEEV